MVHQGKHAKSCRSLKGLRAWLIARRISTLSLVETLLATMLAVLGTGVIGLFGGSISDELAPLWPVAFAFAPLAFLRTDESCQLGLRLLSGFEERFQPCSELVKLCAFSFLLVALAVSVLLTIFLAGTLLIAQVPGFLAMSPWGVLVAVVLMAVPVVGLFLVLLLPFAVRVIATGVSAFRNRRQTLQAIPGNFRRIVLWSHSLMPLESLPRPSGAVPTEDASTTLNAEEVWLELTHEKRSPGGALVTLLAIPVLLLWFVPALIARWSLKSTVVVYWFLLLLPVAVTKAEQRIADKMVKDARIADPSEERAAVFCERLESLDRDGWIPQLAAFLGLSLFAAKIVVFSASQEIGQQLAAWQDIFPNLRVILAIVQPYKIPIWQLVSVAASIGTIVLYRRGIRRWFERSKGPNLDHDRARRALDRAQLALAFAATYTIVCVVLQVVALLPHLRIPDVVLDFLPRLSCG